MGAKPGKPTWLVFLVFWASLGISNFEIWNCKSEVWKLAGDRWGDLPLGLGEADRCWIRILLSKPGYQTQLLYCMVCIVVVSGDSNGAAEQQLLQYKKWAQQAHTVNLYKPDSMPCVLRTKKNAGKRIINAQSSIIDHGHLPFTKNFFVRNVIRNFLNLELWHLHSPSWWSGTGIWLASWKATKNSLMEKGISSALVLVALSMSDVVIVVLVALSIGAIAFSIILAAKAFIDWTWYSESIFGVWPQLIRCDADILVWRSSKPRRCHRRRRQQTFRH